MAHPELECIPRYCWMYAVYLAFEEAFEKASNLCFAIPIRSHRICLPRAIVENLRRSWRWMHGFYDGDEDMKG